MRQDRRLRVKEQRIERWKTFRGMSALLCISVSLLIAFISGNVVIPKVTFHMPTTKVQAEEIKIVSPLPVADYLGDMKFLQDTPTPTATPTILPTIIPTPEVEQSGDIADYIRQVFGSDADKAFLLLSCENKNLDPDIVNTAGNYPEGSRDIGVFQINEYWQAIQAKFLFNYKINVLIAYQLFKENGGSFNLWTCGKNLGI